MFDLVTGTIERPLREKAPGSTLVSIVLHVVTVGLLVGIPLLRMTLPAPGAPPMLAFVVEAASPPPLAALPPEEPSSTARRTPRAPTDTTIRVATPMAAPAEMSTEAPLEPTEIARMGIEGGVRGGIEGGVVGGVPGGVVGGLVSAPPPSLPAPTPAPTVAGPVRVGGQIKTPALAHQVEPVYPALAAAAQISGTVILEAIVGEDGCVRSVKVLQTRQALLDRAAVEALMQWQYTPLLINDTPTAFVLTVTFTFSTR